MAATSSRRTAGAHRLLQGSKARQYLHRARIAPAPQVLARRSTGIRKVGFDAAAQRAGVNRRQGPTGDPARRGGRQEDGRRVSRAGSPSFVAGLSGRPPAPTGSAERPCRRRARGGSGTLELAPPAAFFAGKRWSRGNKPGSLGLIFSFFYFGRPFVEQLPGFALLRFQTRLSNQVLKRWVPGWRGSETGAVRGGANLAPSRASGSARGGLNRPLG